MPWTCNNGGSGSPFRDVMMRDTERFHHFVKASVITTTGFPTYCCFRQCNSKIFLFGFRLRRESLRNSTCA